MKSISLRNKITLFISIIIVIPLAIVSISLYRYIFPPAIHERTYFFRHDPFNSISELAENSSYIIRARIISINEDEDIIGDTVISIISFKVYEIEVLDVFYGETQIGEIMKIIQYTQNRQYNHGEINTRNLRRDVYVYNAPLKIDDDLILFLLPNGLLEYHPINESRTNEFFISLQSSYYYTPKYLNNKQSHWIFESVDENNDLTLTNFELSYLLNIDS